MSRASGGELAELEAVLRILTTGEVSELEAYAAAIGKLVGAAALARASIPFLRDGPSSERLVAGAPLALAMIDSLLASGLAPRRTALPGVGPLDPEPRLAAAAVRWGLTPRQREVVARLVQGQCNKEIAATLECAESTVELHVTAILSKAGCERRAELVAHFWCGG